MSETNKVEITIGARTYSGSYSIDGRTITVRSALYGSKSTQLGAIPAETLAQSLLREIIAASK